MKFSANDISKLGTILSIWAHPDDESFCAGGVFAAAVRNGQRVVVVTATRGDAGKSLDEERWPKDQLGNIREKELMKSLQILGIDNHTWLDYPDGKLDGVNHDEAAAKIATIIEQVQPQTIISFGADGITGHSDHKTVYEWTKTAIIKSKSSADFLRCAGLTKLYDTPTCRRCQEKFNIYFASDTPYTIKDEEADLLFDIPTGLQTLKKQSIEAHECQMSKMLADTDGKAYIDSICCCEAFVREDIN